jgi:hypothetical protein
METHPDCDSEGPFCELEWPPVKAFKAVTDTRPLTIERKNQ